MKIAALVLGVGIMILGIRVDHRRRFVRRPARKLKCHVEGSCTGAKSREAPTRPRASSPEAHRTSRHDALVKSLNTNLKA